MQPEKMPVVIRVGTWALRLGGFRILVIIKISESSGIVIFIYRNMP